MSAMLDLIRSSFRFVTTFLFRCMVLVIPLFAAGAILLAGPDFMQSTLRQSGIYNAAPNAVLSEASKKTSKELKPGEQNILADPGVQEAVKKSVSPQVLDNAFVQISDGVYGWLQGTTKTVQFSIDLSDTKQALTQNLAQYGQTRAASLPLCSPAQLLQQARQGEQDILTATCLPAGTTPQQIGKQFGNDAIQNMDFLKEPKITAATLSKDSGKSLTSNAEWVPEAYKALMFLPWLLGFWALLFGLALLFLHTKRRRGVQVIGTTLLTTGLLLLVGSVLFLLLFKNPGHSVVNGDLPKDFQLAAAKAVTLAMQGYAKTLAIIAAIYTLVGFVIVVTELRTRPKVPVTPPEAAETTHSTELPSVPEHADMKTTEDTPKRK